MKQVGSGPQVENWSGRDSRVWWSGVDGPGQALHDCVVRVNHPASGLGVANGTVVLEEQVHCVFLASAGEFGALATGKEVDID